MKSNKFTDSATKNMTNDLFSFNLKKKRNKVYHEKKKVKILFLYF